MSSPTALPTLRKHQAFQSSHLEHDRDVVVFLPPGYDAEQRFPVLYMHDGQNLFEPDKAFVKGEHWRVGETITELVEAGTIEPLIVVGIYNTGLQRINEYTPTHDRRGGGLAGAYGRFIVEELKPFIDTTYRTLTSTAATGLGGSSLGGLASLYLGLTHPLTFGKIAALSPSVWWDRRAILRDVRRFASGHATETAHVPRPRIWLDMGTRESSGAGSSRRVIDDARLLKVGLVKAGWIEDVDLHYEEVEGATHSERAWGDRFGRVLEWLFAAQVR